MRSIVLCLLLAAPQDRQPVPDAASLKGAEKQVRDLFKDDYARKAPSDVQSLGRKLLTQAGDATIEAPARYVMLRDAKEFAEKTGDVETAIKAIDDLAAAFDVDAIALKAAALGKAAPLVRTPDAALPVAKAYAKLMEDCVAGAAFEAGAGLSSKAEPVARLAADAGTLDRIQMLARDLAYMQKEGAGIKAQRKTLDEKPTDPAANAAVGKFTCLALGQWDKGLPMLTLGNDAAWKDLADKDLANPSDSAAQAAAGDAWWALAEKERSPETKKRLQGRAVFWYEKALGGVTGLARAQLEAKIRAAGRLVFPAGAQNRKTELCGGMGGGPFEDLGAGPSLLIGVRVSLTDITKSIQPVFLTNNARAEGKMWGDPVPPLKEITAKTGYAVGGLTTTTPDGSGRVRGFRLTFMRIAGTSLDPRDSYQSDWVGMRGAGTEMKLAGDGSYVIGIHGRCATDLDALGLVFLGR